MKSTFVALLTALAIASAVPLGAQSTAEEEKRRAAEEKARAEAREVAEKIQAAARAEVEAQMKKAREQFRQAERQMREAERAMREASRASIEANQDRLRAKLDAASKEYSHRVVVYSGDHARLGVVLSSQGDEDSKQAGVRIVGLTPGGPAEEAGLAEGDIIVKLGDTAITSSKDDEDGPAEQVQKYVRKLKDGDKVMVEVLRDKQTKKLMVTARASFGPKVRMMPYVHFESDGVEPPEPPEPRAALEYMYWSGRWRDLELVALNPDLGDYFGSKEGLLVVRVSHKETGELKAGDVILRIGDRTPKTPAEAFRILRSYGPGERMSLEIMRNRTKITISIDIPRQVGLLESLAVPPMEVSRSY
jgi:C-terminal processing protease CtpA/Prc